MKKIILLCLCFFAQALYAEDTVYFGVKPPKEQIKLTDKFSVYFDIAFPQNYEVQPDTASFPSDNFEALSFENTGVASSDTLKSSLWQVDAQAFCIGNSTFPAITWNLIQDGKKVSSAKSPEFGINVLPLFDEKEIKNSDIRDIYPPFKFHNWLLLLLILLTAGGAAFLILKKIRERRLAKITRILWKDNRTPYQRAYERSCALENTNLLDRGLVKEFYIGLSSIFRFYLSEVYAIDAELLTSLDLIKRMRNAGIEAKSIKSAREFLSRADMVKFAKFRPENAGADIVFLRDILNALEIERIPAENNENLESGQAESSIPSPIPPLPPTNEQLLSSGNMHSPKKHYDESRWQPKPQTSSEDKE